MNRSTRVRIDPAGLIISVAAAVFFAIHTATSCARWANFGYRTFDLAYYVQAIWQLIHGRFQVSVEHVPLLGNHVEPIVLLIAPLFAVFHHPMVFVVVQNAALAAMGPLAYNIARRMGFNRTPGLVLAAALLVAPASGYIALHEFHPEALAAPLLLLMLQARMVNSLARYWLWFAAVLACKENLALLLAAYCAVHLVIKRRRPFRELAAWYLWPMAASVAWLLICVKVITPALNAGNIDYFALYDRLGNSPSDILVKATTEPWRILHALGESLARGNMLPALLLPFLGLPLLRPRWLLIASPILFQHLLSWRSSEWMIYFHYAAPLLPLLWMAFAESVLKLRRFGGFTALAPGTLAGGAMVACVAAQVVWGPAAGIASAAAAWPAGKPDRERKAVFLAKIPADASVMAPLPYLSHLAMRQELYSLHYILKGLKTLSRAQYEPPPPPEFVLIDYNDSATFDANAGYYHPTMRTVAGQIVPSSDKLLHDFLKGSSWVAETRNEFALLERAVPRRSPEPPEGGMRLQIGEHTELESISASRALLMAGDSLNIELIWDFKSERAVIPWMFLNIMRKGADTPAVISKGLCAPEAALGRHKETWHVDSMARLPTGNYSLEVVFVDNSSRVWFMTNGGVVPPSARLSGPISLGDVTVSSDGRSPNR